MAASIPGPARDLVRLITQAVDLATPATDTAAAAGAGRASGGASGRASGGAPDRAGDGADASGYGRVTALLAAQPAGGRILGDVLRSLLEDSHPDGFTSDDITLVIGRCYRAAAGWLPAERVDVTILLAVLASALGIHEPGVTYEALDLARPDADEFRDPDDAVPVRPPTWPDYAWHAPLLVADLLPFVPATLDSYLEAVFAEYAREAREEYP